MITVIEAYNPRLTITKAPPSVVREGETVEVSGLVRGTDPYGTEYWVVNPYIQIYLNSSLVASGHGGSDGFFTLSFRIPSGTAGKTLKCLIRFVEGTYVVDVEIKDTEYPKMVYCSRAEKSYSIAVGIPTSITISVSPLTVTPGTEIKISGKLVRSDTGEPLDGKPVKIWWRPPEKLLAETVTDSDGHYEYKYTIPSDVSPGTYYIKAVFEGEGYAIAGERITVEGEANPIYMVLAAIPLITAGMLIVGNEMAKHGIS